jgi:hypothetical protein
MGGTLSLVFYSCYVRTPCRGLIKYVLPLLFSQGGNIPTAPAYSNSLISYLDQSVASPNACKPKLAANTLPADDSEIALLLALHTATQI